MLIGGLHPSGTHSNRQRQWCVEAWLLQHTHIQHNHYYSCSLRSATTALSSYGVFDWWMRWLLLWDNWYWEGAWSELNCTASYRPTAHTGPLHQSDTSSTLSQAENDPADSSAPLESLDSQMLKGITGCYREIHTRGMQWTMGLLRKKQRASLKKLEH